MTELYILGKNRKFLNVIGMPFKEKVFHLRLRQSWIVKNHKTIEILRTSPDHDPKELAKMEHVNKGLRLEVEKIKFSTYIDDQTPLEDHDEYREYFQDDWNVLQKVIDRDPRLFAEFAKEFFKKQNTTVAIKYLKEVAINHQLILSQQILED